MSFLTYYGVGKKELSQLRFDLCHHRSEFHLSTHLKFQCFMFKLNHLGDGGLKFSRSNFSNSLTYNPRGRIKIT